MRITCPQCGFVFNEPRPHRPFRCPACGALLTFTPTGPITLFTVGELLTGRDDDE